MRHTKPKDLTPFKTFTKPKPKTILNQSPILARLEHSKTAFGGLNLRLIISLGLGLGLSMILVSPTLLAQEQTDPKLYEQVKRDQNNEILYFVIPDRFSNGNMKNDCGNTKIVCKDNAPKSEVLQHGFLKSDKGFYHGGDLVGLRNKLDYLQELGVTAIWVGPIFGNKSVQDDSSNLYGKSSAYHGYWITDFMNVDPHLGTNDEFKQLIEAAHQRGIKVFMDIITNHTADVIQYKSGGGYKSKADAPYKDAAGQPFNDAWFAYTGKNSLVFPTMNMAGFPYEPVVPVQESNIKNPAWLNNPMYYHNRGNTSFSGENSMYGDFFGLDDLFTERKDVVDGMIDIYQHWIKTYKVDGFRIDTTKHVNMGFWKAFGPAIMSQAKQSGIDHFFAFGEVYDQQYGAEFLSAFSTQGQLSSTIDFAFQVAARDFASKGGKSSDLRKFFESDDYYTDGDSNAYRMPTFLGNHDMGRFGYFINQDQSKASMEEKTKRFLLAHGLMFTSRGQPVLYYGDEQGFTGDGGDKDAREDMFASKVAVYNDNILLGNKGNTALDNFDTQQPVFKSLSKLSQLYKNNPGMRHGAQIHRYSEDGAGLYAFSRFDPKVNREYVVVLNNSTTTKSAQIPMYGQAGDSFDLIYTGALDSSTLYPSVLVNKGGLLPTEVPALTMYVYRANQAASTAKSVSIPNALKLQLNLQNTKPYTLAKKNWDGQDLYDRLPIEVKLDPQDGSEMYTDVAFEVSVNGGKYQSLGTDYSAPYRVFYDANSVGASAKLDVRAVATTLTGQKASAEVKGVHIIKAGSVAAGKNYNYAVVHYQRKNKDYGSKAANTLWGLHTWGEAVKTGQGENDWKQPIPMLGEDAFGRFAFVELKNTSNKVNFILHTPNGDIVGKNREAAGDRSFDPAIHPEIWVKEGDEKIYTENPEPVKAEVKVKTMVRIHYHRPDGQYNGWGLHTWGDSATSTNWNTPLTPTGQNDFGSYWDVPLKKDAVQVNYIIHKGDQKDPGGDQVLNLAKDGVEVWQKQDADPKQPLILPIKKNAS